MIIFLVCTPLFLEIFSRSFFSNIFLPKLCVYFQRLLCVSVAFYLGFEAFRQKFLIFHLKFSTLQYKFPVLQLSIQRTLRYSSFRVEISSISPEIFPPAVIFFLRFPANEVTCSDAGEAAYYHLTSIRPLVLSRLSRSWSSCPPFVSTLVSTQTKP